MGTLEPVEPQVPRVVHSITIPVRLENTDLAMVTVVVTVAWAELVALVVQAAQAERVVRVESAAQVHREW